MNGTLPWRDCVEEGEKIEAVRGLKTKCVEEPEKHLWGKFGEGLPETRNIFESVKGLKYEDRPDYGYIRQQLLSILAREEPTAKVFSNAIPSTIGPNELPVRVGCVRCVFAAENVADEQLPLPRRCRGVEVCGARMLSS